LAPLRFRVPESGAGERLDRVLAGRPEISARARAERLLDEGAVRVDGRVLPKSHRLAGGEEVEVELPGEPALGPATRPVTVVYEDRDLLVVDKPAGIAVHPGGRSGAETLVQGLLPLGAAGGEPERPGIVHRLDRDTSGLLLVARSPAAHRRLQELVRRRRVERRYLALVRGSPRSKAGRIEAPIGRDRRDRRRHSLDTATPRDAVTLFEVLETMREHALLEVGLETGRTHQIRVHLEAIGLPIAGDPVYGVPGELGLDRQFLHAHRLRFVHPFTGAELDLRSPLPGELEAALERARAL
jgi:23S rRNA pseudouridine1911/1915/1917 synthase